ncbi:TPA: EAL domain-containing protein [Vibrio vulnificus]|nr:EAL domain-containing protein [Vibrio vulnificus]
MLEVTKIKRDLVTIQSERAYVTLEFLLQPIYSPKNREIIFYEALTRIVSESGETLNSESFFENIDDEFIKKVVILQMECFSSVGLSKKIFLNVNLSSLSDDYFVDYFILNNKLNLFQIEINEINLTPKEVSVLKNIKKLHSVGVWVILDDYYHENEAAGLSLGVIDWDYIKIDKSFLFYNSDNDDCLSSMIYVMKPYCKYGLIIEGVETSLQNDFLRCHDVLGQGFYHSRPEKYTKFLSLNKNVEKIFDDQH